MDGTYRPRRTCLSVPGSSPSMIEKAKSLRADQVFLDLEDSVAPDAKAAARTRVAAALTGPGWSGQLLGVRVNDWTTPWTYLDVIEVVSAAGSSLEVIVLPKVIEAGHVYALDLLLTQLERGLGLPAGRIGVDVQIEDARGLSDIAAIARAPRVQALVLGPADLIASLNMRTLEVGEQPQGYDVGDAYHHALMTILVAARANGLAAVDGPFLKVRDDAAFRRVAGRSAALGYDGKWVVHPDQIAAGNEIFTPRQQDYDRAELILEAYDWYTSQAGGARGAAMLGAEMIDEASRKMALVVAGKGRAAGLQRGPERFVPPGDPERNDTGAREGFLDRLPFDPARVHPMPDSEGAADPEAGARAYAAELALAAGPEGVVPAFDVLMLGVGPEGHVASLFPDLPGVHEAAPVVAVLGSPKPPPTRISLTFPSIRSAREVWLIASGEGKAAAMAAAADPATSAAEVPAAGARGQERTVFWLDEPAASGLGSERGAPA